MFRIPIDAIIDFLLDESLGPIKIKNNDKYNFELSINEPYMWGTNDTKMRCGIAAKYIHDDMEKQIVVFNAFKARALYGDEYKGSFFKFIKNVKNFNSISEAKRYFIENYLLKYDVLVGTNSIDTLMNYYENINNMNLDNENDKIIIQQKNNNNITLPEHFEPLNINEHKMYVNYLLKRNVDLKKIKKLKIYVDKLEKRLVFPIYDNGQLIAYCSRDVTGISPLRWKNSETKNKYPVWNLDQIDSNVVYVFEGIFDAIHFYNNGVALNGVGSEKQMEKIKNRGFSRIILVFDNDIAGRKAKIKWANWLTKKGYKHTYIFDYSGIKEKDFGEIYAKKININFRERIFFWNYNTEIKVKMGQIL